MADNFATFMCRLSGNSGSLCLLQPWGPVQGSIRTALLYLFGEKFSNIYKPKCTTIRRKQTTETINSVLHSFLNCKEKIELSTLAPRGEFQTPQPHFIHPAKARDLCREIFVHVFKAAQQIDANVLKDNEYSKVHLKTQSVPRSKHTPS